MICPSIYKTRKFNYYLARKQGLPTDPSFVHYIESWAKRTFIVPPRMNAYIQVNMEIQQVFQEFAAPDDIYPYSIDEGFIDLTSSLNYFIPDPQLDRRSKLDLLSARIQKRICKNWDLRYCRDEQCQSPTGQTSSGQRSQAPENHAG